MEYYKNEIKRILEDIVDEHYETREQVLQRWSDGDTQDDFGNMTGSRFCSAWKAKQALIESGFPFDEELNQLLIDCGYDLTILDKGPEVADVVLCELVASSMIDEL